MKRINRLTSTFTGLALLIAVAPLSAQIPNPRVTVAVIALDHASGLNDTNNPFAISGAVPYTTDLTIGSHIYVEVWATTPPPNGLTSAYLDLFYNTAFLSTSNA